MPVGGFVVVRQTHKSCHGSVSHAITVIPITSSIACCMTARKALTTPLEQAWAKRG